MTTKDELLAQLNADPDLQRRFESAKGKVVKAYTETRDEIEIDLTATYTTIDIQRREAKSVKLKAFRMDWVDVVAAVGALGVAVAGLTVPGVALIVAGLWAMSLSKNFKHEMTKQEALTFQAIYFDEDRRKGIPEQRVQDKVKAASESEAGPRSSSINTPC